jgi:hypothetical protein
MWEADDRRQLKWFPTVVDSSPPEQYYTLDSDVVFAPFHSLEGWNPGHLVWDDFYPIFTLLDMFQLYLEEETNNGNNIDDDNDVDGHDDYRNNLKEALLMSYLPPNFMTQIGCNENENRRNECTKMMNKFRPIMMYHHRRTETITTSSDNNVKTNKKRQDHLQTTFLTNQFDAKLTPIDGKPLESDLVCAKDGIAGLGPLSDHGTKPIIYAWNVNSYRTKNHIGKGGLLWRFRNYCLNNLGLVDRNNDNNNNNNQGDGVENKPPPKLKIVLSMPSSTTMLAGHTVDLSKHEQYLRQKYKDQNNIIEVESHKLEDLELIDQIQLAMETTVFVSLCGGSSVTGMFMPKGTSLVVYYSEIGGRKQSNPLARRSWDILNNLSYLRMHWLPTATMDTEQDMAAFLDLIDHEIKLHLNK